MTLPHASSKLTNEDINVGLERGPTTKKRQSINLKARLPGNEVFLSSRVPTRSLCWEVFLAPRYPFVTKALNGSIC